VSPKWHHKHQIWRLMESTNLKYLPKSEYFFGILSVILD
jgi:hypothetical protein